MRVRVGFVLMSCLVSALLFLVSCGQPAQTGTTTPPVTTASSQPTTTVPTLPKPASDKPQYGGTLTVSQTSDITGFDEAYTAHNTIATIKLTNEELLTGDWTKGPAGTGQFQFISSGANRSRFQGRLPCRIVGEPGSRASRLSHPPWCTLRPRP